MEIWFLIFKAYAQALLKADLFSTSDQTFTNFSLFCTLIILLQQRIEHLVCYLHNLLLLQNFPAQLVQKIELTTEQMVATLQQVHR